jgi:hypothetical protein
VTDGSALGVPVPNLTDVVILDRIEPGWTPPYCTHGRATCVGGCGEWLWLGDKTHDVVKSGRAAPLCHQCARRLIPPGARAARNIGDHRRADGPHT